MELDKQSVTVPQLRKLAHNFGSTHYGLAAVGGVGGWPDAGGA